MTGTGAVLALAAGVLLACASDGHRAAAAPEAPAASEAAQVVAVTGRVTVTGSAPHVTLVVVTEAGKQYELVGERADPLWDLQQRRVIVQGRVVQPAIGPGFPAQLEVESYALAHASG